ncbi:E3 ubiquitin-protein ligase TRIM33-like isoform X2 [Littorina saxatilis]|uniref:E3 ubiquitin-protein ligase TRIM33-like isoform X2 n=1 Tax=Littorina saxatilis TaxID=31220 RepID=UPI0038B62C1D
MATASQPVEPNEKECSVCHEDFTDPKVLPCGHLLCRHCLLSWLNTQTDAHCPLCRCAILEPTSDTVSFEDVADSFPTDLAMKAVVDADRILNKDHSCCVCEDVAATSMCLDCGDMLCTACTKVHGKLSMTKHHTVEDLSFLTAEKLAEKQQETCHVHAQKPSEVYCPTHGTSICLLCATTDHRQCPDVTKLETKAEEARATLRELAAILSAGETTLDRAIAQLDDHLQETEKRTKAAIAEIQEMCDRLEAAVKACRHRLTNLAESACDDVKEAVQDGKTRLLSRRGKLTAHKRVVDRSQGKTARASLTTMAVTMKTRVVTLDCSATLPPDAKTINSVTLTIDTKVVSSLEQGLSQLGEIHVVSAGVLGQYEEFVFHEKHGADVVLSSNRKEAQKKGTQHFHGIVFSSQPMKVNRLYEKESSLGENTAYSRQPDGSRIGVFLDHERNLHLYVNGDDIGIAAHAVPEPAFALFDLWHPGKITALPVTPLP